MTKFKHPPRRVYFAQRENGEGPIKIGCSSYVSDRVQWLGWSLRAKLTVLASAPGGFPEERALHREFASERREGEWFNPAPALIALIDEIRANGRLPFEATDRDQIIIERYSAGEPLRAIGRAAGLSGERVRQILRALGVPSRRTSSAAKAREAA